MGTTFIKYFAYVGVGFAAFAVSLALDSLMKGNDAGVNSLAAKSYTFIDPWKDFYVRQVPTKEEVSEHREVYKPTCNDPKIKPLWIALHKDREFRERIDGMFGEHDCKDMFEIYPADLNQDGKKEIFIRGSITEFCGGVGNCMFWTLEKRSRGYKILISSTDYVDRSGMGEQIRKTFSKGYSDILLKGHFSAAETSFSYYKFDGRRYRESKCLYELPVGYNGDEPVWGFISCKEFTRRLDAEIAAQSKSK